MTQLTIISTILLASSMSFAIIAKPKPVTPPTVSCTYMVDVNDQSSGNIDFKYGQPLKLTGAINPLEEKTTETMGFTLKGTLRRVCALAAGMPKPPGVGGPGGGGMHCTNGYDLSVTLDFAQGISSVHHMSLTKEEKNKRLSGTLVVGNRTASVNCDVQ